MVHEHTLEVQSIIHAGLLLTEQLVTRLSWQFIGWLDTTLTCTGVLSSREHTRGHVYKEKSLAAFRARLRVVYNFGDGDCGAGEMHTRACEISRQRDAKLVPKLAPKIRGGIVQVYRKLETTDKAREFELSAYIPSAKL